jgi:hypothetical protein
MSQKIFTNPTGAFGYTADGDVLPQVVGEFRVKESSSAAVTITKGYVVQIDANGHVSQNDTLETDPVLGVALDTVTVADNDSASYTGPKTVRVCLLGVCEVRSDGGNDATLGTPLYAAADGEVSAGTSTAGDFIVGIALESIGSSAGALVTALVRPQVITA